MGTLLHFDWLVDKVQCPSVSTDRVNLKRENYEYHHRNIYIFRALSYILRSMIKLKISLFIYLNIKLLAATPLRSL